ncbi:MAG: GNAT family N-acetyltransferase [Cognatishimia sp.]
MSSSFEIRPAISDDALQISAMMMQSYGQLLADDYNPRILAKALPRISTARPELLSCGTYFVATDRRTGQVIGAGGWTDVSPTRGLAARGEGHMRHVAVDPSALRLGVGRALADVSFQTAKGQGMCGLRCMSTLTAQPFYEAMGFSYVQDIELTLEPGLFFPAVEMRMRLH